MFEIFLKVHPAEVRQNVAALFARLLDSGVSRNPQPSWALWIGSAVLAAVAGSVAYGLSQGPQAYSQFIAGPIAWRAASKAHDYHLLLAILFGFLAAFGLFTLQSAWIGRRLGAFALQEFHTLVAFASLPAVLWFGRLVLTREVSLSLLRLSALFLCLVLVFSAAALRKKLNFDSAAVFSSSVSASVLALIWGMLGGMAVALAVSRLGVLFNLPALGADLRFARWSVGIFAFLGSLLVGFAWFLHADSAAGFLGRLRALVIALQAPFPWFFLILLPTPWVSQGHRYYGFPIRPMAWVVIAGLILAAYGDLARKWRRKAVPEKAILSAVSPLCLIAVLLFIKCGIVDPTVSSDDYSFGEFAIPWWSWSVHNLVPFWDYTPARGLINYAHGLFASIFFDGTAAAFPAGGSFLAAFLALVCFPLIARSIGLFPAFVAFIPMPLLNGISEIDLLMTAGLCVLCETYLRTSSSRWVPLWLALGIASVLVGVAQGGLLVLATLPLAISAASRSLKENRRKFYRGMAILLGAGAVLSLITPLRHLVYGAMRYGFEHSSVNSIAHSVEWAESWKVGGAPINPWLWESARSSWILVGILAGLVILYSVARGFGQKEKRALVYAVPIFLLTVLYIFRAGGRIDPGSVSRLGFASVWAHSLLLPILLLNTEWGKRRTGLVLTVMIFLAAILSPFFTPLNLWHLRIRSTEAVAAPSGDGIRAGLPNLGRGTVEPKHLERLLSMKRVLARLVDPGETYLDLTNHNAHYFYLGYPPPIEVGAVYNLVHEDQQVRAIRKLDGNPPPVIALDTTVEQRYDGGPVGYRSHLLYRYVIGHYTPVEIDGRIYMIKPERLKRLGGEGGSGKERAERLALLDRVFRMGNIEELPVSWGRAFPNLKKNLRLVRRFPADSQPSLHSVRRNGNGSYSIEGPRPSVTFDIAPWKLSGLDAGFLTFDFQCGGAEIATGLAVTWAGDAGEPAEPAAVGFKARNGTLAVPLDAEPRWLLAEGIREVRLELVDPAPCTTISVANVAFWQRVAVDRIPK